MSDDRHGDRVKGRPSDASDAPEAPVEARSTDWTAWSNLWQVPAIVVSIAVILLGLYVAMQRAPRNDFVGAFEQIDELIAAEEFELAAAQLNEVVEPNLAEATPFEQARFEATVADWISLSQESAGLNLDDNNERIVKHYTKAVDLGAVLAPVRLERWANALLSLGDLEAARMRLAELEDEAAAPGAELEIRRRRNRVLRRLVEISLAAPDLTYDSLMEMLEGYRIDPMLAGEDELWAIARQAELRLEGGFAQEAVDRLLVDMRRIEPQSGDVPPARLGELYALLGRGYYDLGNFPYARYHVEQAMDLVPQGEPARATALVLAGRIAVGNGEWDDAFDAFDQVVRNYAATRSAPSGRLGRAEVYSVLGDAKRSLADYRALHALLAEGPARRDITMEEVGASLADRHDAALTAGRLDAALEYIMLAETFYEPGRVAPEVLFRVASTSRQLADNKAFEARGGPYVDLPGADVDPEARFEADKHYRRAGDYYVRHARDLAGRPGQDDNWAESLWLAADSFDLGGWHDRAVTHFTEYLAGRSDADPRRVDALFRLARAYDADLDHESAATYYQQVIDQHPRSHVATRSFVPLARCLVALGRRPEARQQLNRVLTGRRHLGPEAVDYRDALIELGTIYYDDGEYTRAIEQLDEAARRYVDDSRIGEIRFRLADSYRRRAEEIEQELSAPVVTPDQRRRLESMRRDHLTTARELFSEICRAGLPGRPAGNRQAAEQLLRYASMYQADCAFELGMYDTAVELYDEFAGRFPKHHSSMTALIQIVNCYSNLGDTSRAQTAHRRAIVRLQELPDEAFDEPDALLNRDAWERWLENMPVNDTKTASAASS